MNELNRRVDGHINMGTKISTTLVAVAVSLALGGISNIALAQTNEVEQDVELISVTGSRLKSSNALSSQPMNDMSAEEFAATGALTISDAINELPQIGEAMGASSQDINSLNNGFGVGTETINLRNLGAQRTLVLVNGRRHVGGDPGTSSVDMNSIPAAMISNIEVITGAASAVYGADAVSGVVNVILKDDYKGTTVDFRTGISKEGDGEEYSASLTHGNIFGGSDQGQYLFSMEYTQDKPILGADRPFAQFDGSATTGLSEESGGSGVNGGGLFASDGSIYPAGTGGFATDGTFTQPFSERYQRVPNRFLQNATERLVASGNVKYDLTSDATFFIESTVSNSVVEVQFDPQLAIFSSAGFDGSGSAGFRFPTANTHASDGLRAITRRFVEYGPRSTEIERDMYRFATGIEGYLGDNNYEIYYQYGNVNSTQTDFNTIDKLKLVTAINQTECATTIGCVFADIYGRGTLDPASLSFVASDLESTSESTQHVLSGFVSGELMSIGDNFLQYVVGAEYRKEEVSVNPNRSLIAVPNTFTGGDATTLPDVGTQGTRTFAGNTKGDYDVTEVFSELMLPIGDNASLKGAVRYSDYSTVGGEFTWGLTGNWSITEWASLRGSFGSATRAPNINELYAPTVSVTGSVVDVCEGATGQIATNCASLIPSYDPATFEQSEFQENIRVLQNGGNSQLTSELADTFTLGGVVNITKGLIVTLDYYSIQMEDVLSTAFSSKVTADRCAQTLAPQFCNQITRDSNGIITSIMTQQVNLAEEGVKGIDFTVLNSWDLGRGELGLKVQLSHLLEHTRKVNDEALEEDITGRVDNIQNKLNSTLTYSDDAWRLAVTARYLDSAVQTTNELQAAAAPGNNIGSQVYIDLNANYIVSEEFKIGVGIKNLTNREAPVVTELYENNGSGATTAGGIYDSRGQFFYLSGSYTF
jgi:iron complex outermembrane receptor protein